MNIRLLNVDLEVKGHRHLQALVDAFGDEAVNLYCGEARSHQLATFEAPEAVSDADRFIGYFCTLTESGLRLILLPEEDNK